MRKFGNWTYNKEENTLEMGGHYWIAMDEIKNSDDALRWMSHVEVKSWSTPADIGNLLVAMKYHCPELPIVE